MDRDAIAEPRSSGDAPEVPGPGEVHVWRVELRSGDGRGAARSARDRILASYLGASAEIALTVAPGGKPRLASAPERLSFNLSHSGDLALLVIAPGGVEVGVDVERMRPRRDLARLAARWLPHADAIAVATAHEAEQEAAFYAAWTRHEARVKCTGAGLAGPEPGPDVHAWPLQTDPGYAAAVALAGSAEPRVLLRA
jgi:4'-phosphopantetheinyl transferase